MRIFFRIFHKPKKEREDLQHKILRLRRKRLKMFRPLKKNLKKKPFGNKYAYEIAKRILEF